ncbi:GNAT family N-acetyltransferase [Actibacterium ureilyticum]|uniref:GNAT family N-acetyltransferase n=1 Tax=Actibacterium ureilyticum TaxID=1590614 RepID=UPI000BAACDB7|nr:GNAT family N-acetyltransferase [Actibacterium ureilyticum]
MGAVEPLTIRTPRLILRQMRRDDAAALCRIVTRPDVGRMLFLFPPDWTVDAAQDFILDWQFRGTPRLRLGICDASDRLLGSVGAVLRDGRIEVFYFLDPAAAGQGYATEAMQAFIGFLFDRFGHDTIHADVFIDNPGSERVLRKLGFTFDGQGTGTSAARLEPFPVSLYRLTQQQFKAATT